MSKCGGNRGTCDCGKMICEAHWVWIDEAIVCGTCRDKQIRAHNTNIIEIIKSWQKSNWCIIKRLAIGYNKTKLRNLINHQGCYPKTLEETVSDQNTNNVPYYSDDDY